MRAVTESNIEEAIFKLAEQNKRHGYITLDDVNDVLPAGTISSDLMEDVLYMLEEQGLTLIREGREQKKGVAEEEAEVQDIHSPDILADPKRHYDDPKDLYMNEATKSSTITPEEEKALFKALDEARLKVKNALSLSLTTYQKVKEWQQVLADRKIHVRDLIQQEASFEEQAKEENEAEGTNEESQVNGGRLAPATLKLMECLAHYCAAFESYRQQEQHENDDNERAVMQTFTAIPFTPARITELAEEIQNFYNNLHSAESALVKRTIECGVQRDEFYSVYKSYEKDLRWLNSRALQKDGRWRMLITTAQKEIDMFLEARGALIAAVGGHDTQAESIAENVVRVMREVMGIKRRLTQANLRLVIFMARRYERRGIGLMDLIQEGNIGLMRALDKFDYQRGYKFSTYAVWWIRQAITRALEDKGRTIRVPPHVTSVISKLAKTARSFVNEKGRQPTVEELAALSHMSQRQIDELWQVAREPVSLSAPIGEEEDAELGNFIEDTNAVIPEDAVAQENLQAMTMGALKGLPEREAEILKLRFGIGTDREHTLEEIGRKFHLSRERIRQIEAKVMEKLQHSRQWKMLKSFLYS